VAAVDDGEDGCWRTFRTESMPASCAPPRMGWAGDKTDGHRRSQFKFRGSHFAVGTGASCPPLREATRLPRSVASGPSSKACFCPRKSSQADVSSCRAAWTRSIHNRTPSHMVSVHGPSAPSSERTRQLLRGETMTPADNLSLAIRTHLLASSVPRDTPHRRTTRCTLHPALHRRLR
jgi:hypothetical protein